ncbi:MAG: ATP-binding cassette domain-containing protein, partial [Planctomycetota bacterium]
IVGLAGLVGAGRTELLEAIFGITRRVGGTILVDGVGVDVRTPRDAVAKGIGLVPEDRKLHGLILEQTIRRNVSLATFDRDARAGFVNRGIERHISADMMDRLHIRASSDAQESGTLSGGNQQKVVLGKWLATNPGVLLLDEPTRGVDVGARSEIYRIMESLAERGVATLFASSDLEEVIALSDRVVVMSDGRIAGELPAQPSETDIMRLATGREEAA